MYLSALCIENFRCLEKIQLRFRTGLNILVGPNNVGKTAVADGLRALLSASDEAALRFDDYDLHLTALGTKAVDSSFHFVFRGLTEIEEADFLAALRPIVAQPGQAIEYEAHLHVRYSAVTPGGRLRPKRWCGDHEENAITSEMLEDLRAVYLPPLRDPASGLRPSRTSQLAKLIERLADDASKQKIVDLLKNFEIELAKQEPVANTQKAIVARHEEMLGQVLKQALKVGLTEPEFQRLAARLTLAVEGLDIEQNGLGFNNLIYMAVVLSELALNPDAAYKALIVEEPEAHLHPQLQAVLLEYLQSKETPPENEKAVQVFVTSHSPNFASIANIDTLGCLHKGKGTVKAFYPRDVNFGKNKKEKLQRYLDVTRAELFFARKLILVEGAAERFLVTALANKLQIDLRKHSVSLICTEGLNFDCFVPLFGELALELPVAILTDADPPNQYPEPGDVLALSDAAASIAKFSNSFIKPFFAQKTLEYDFALIEENLPGMLAALSEIHPTIAANLENEVNAATSKDRAKVLFCGMFERDKGSNIQKGAYAQSLAHEISKSSTTFTAPQYIKDALEYIVKA